MKQYCATTKHFATCHHLLQFALLLCRLPKTHFRLSYFRRYFVFTHTRPCILCLCHHCSVAFFSLMPATCFTVLLSCFPFYYCLTFLCVYYEYLHYFAVIAARYSICTLDKNHQHHFSHILHLQFHRCMHVCDCAENSQKKVAVIIVEEEYVSSSVTHCCLLQQSAQPLHCSLTRVFSALFNAFFCHSKLITASANTHCIEVLQEIYHFRFFFFAKARNLWRWKKKRLRNMRWKVVSWHLI